MTMHSILPNNVGKLDQSRQNDPDSTNQENAIDTFRAVIASKESRSRTIVERVADVIMATGIADGLKPANDPSTRYVVNITPEIKEALDKGLIKLDKGKDGRLYAQLRDESNRYGSKLSISEELTEQGISPAEAVTAFQIQSIKEQLEEMAEAIDAISKDVESVLRGQQNDRLGLYYAGESLFLEARVIRDPLLKATISAQALKSLSDASAQLAKQLEEDLLYLIDGGYKTKRGKQAEEIEARMASINKSFEVIHKAALLKATVYYEEEELPAMLATIGEYGKLLERTITPNAHRLAEFDRADNLLKGGVWEKRARILSSVKSLESNLETANTFYLDTTPEED